MKHIYVLGALLCAASLSSNIQAKEQHLNDTREQGFATVTHTGGTVKVQRNQDAGHLVDDPFANSSRPCPPYCVKPIALHDDVETVAELDVIEFMQGPYNHGRGVIVDVRTPSWFKRGTIPGSVNMPFTVFEKAEGDIELVEALVALGGKERGDVSTVTRAVEALGFMDGDMKTDKWDFSDARDVVLWCNGPWCGQSPRAIRGLLKVGYPADKIFYYRGGLQTWQSLGLTTVKPGDNTVAAN